MARTYEEIINGPSALRGDEYRKIESKKRRIIRGAYSFFNKTRTGRCLRNSAIVGAVALGALLYGAKNADSINKATDEAASQVTSVVQQTEMLTDKVNYILSETPKGQDTSHDSENIGKFLYTKKEVCLDLLNKEPNNNEAQNELQKLDALISAYEQIYNSKQ